MILPHRKRWPKIHETAFVAPSADIIGEVEIGSHSSVWFQCVIRGDVQKIQIGDHTNIQDHSVLHATRSKTPLKIGDQVTVGHRVALHGCTIGNRVLVGMGSIVLDEVEIGDECFIGAGSLITQKTKIPPQSLVFGSPAKVIRSLTAEEIAFLSQSAANYVGDAAEYQGCVPSSLRMGNGQSDLDHFPRDFGGDFSGDFEDSFGKDDYEGECR